MNAFQSKVFEIVKWFHNFCIENNLQYYMLGGTMLGAIRHKGFIPWDDDADFGMPRPDYEKFISLTRNLQSSFIQVESFHNGNSDFPYPFVKIYNKTTSLVENLRFPVKRGIYVDIFPLDKCNSKEGIAINRFFFLINLYNLKICKKKKNRTFCKRFSLSVFQFFHRKKPNYYKNCIKLDKTARLIDLKGKKFYANFYGAWGKKEIISIATFGEPTEYSFEGISLYGPCNYEDYLTSLYGDYSILPPIEKRGEHHDYLEVALDKGFTKV